MKLSKIKRAIKGGKLWTLVTMDDGAQWIGDVNAMYAVPRSIDMTTDNATSILDIDADKRAEYSVREIDDPEPWWDMLPCQADDVEMTIKATVQKDGRNISILTTAEGECLMVDDDYLRPCEDAEFGLAFALRRRYNKDTGEETEPIVVVFDDMMACAPRLINRGGGRHA